MQVKLSHFLHVQKVEYTKNKLQLGTFNHLHIIYQAQLQKKQGIN